MLLEEKKTRPLLTASNFFWELINRMKLWSNSSVPRSNGTFNPERRLLAAVLQRAITDYLTGDGELRESAEDWLFCSDDISEAFGFAYICEALDFHREELRKAIRRQFDASQSSGALGASAISQLALA